MENEVTVIVPVNNGWLIERRKRPTQELLASYIAHDEDIIELLRDHLNLRIGNGS